MSAVDITNYGTLHLRNIETSLVGDSFMGEGVPAPLKISARDPSGDVANNDNYIEMTLQYASGVGNSELSFKEYGDTGGAGGTAVTDSNITITGIANPTLDSDLATKAYVDNQTAAIFQVHTAAKAASEGSFALTYASNDADGTTPSTITLNANTAGGQWSDGDAQNTNVRCDNVLLVATDRVFINKSGGGDAHADSDGIYEVTSITGGAAFTVLLTRTTDAKVFTPVDDSQFLKGEFIVVKNGDLNAGRGYYLTADVANPTTVQNWALFSSTRTITALTPIEPRDYAGQIKFTIAGDAGGADEGKVITAGSGGQNGVCQVSTAFGLASGPLAINGTNNVINDLGLSTYACNQLNLVTPTLDIDSSDSITINATGGNCQVWAAKNLFAREAGGTVKLSALDSATDARLAGNIMPSTSQYTDTTEAYGSGVLFQQVADFGGTNSNRGRFLMAPHNSSVSNERSLDILGFADGPTGARIVLAQIIP